MIDRFFSLSERGTSVKREMLCGLTTFLSMMYILFANSDILSEVGMPWYGVYAATALSAAVCTGIVALYANLPFAMAPGMGLNTIFAYTICMGMGYHWKEALAVVFMSGLLHFLIMKTSLRKAFVNAFPEYLRIAAGAGLGLFIAYVGLKNTGLLEFNFSGIYAETTSEKIIVNGSLVVPSLNGHIAPAQLVALISFTVMIILSALERKTGDRYVALPVGILIATFIGIPLGVTGLMKPPAADASMGDGLRQVMFSFFGSPGLFTIFSEPSKAVSSVMTILILLMTGILDSVGTMIGLGQIHNAKIFDDSDMQIFSTSPFGSKLDKALVTNSIGNTVAPLFGASPATIFLESATGIVSGGRTGLTGLVAGVLFLLFLPFASLFYIIPSEAVAPALILAGASMLTRMEHIEWRTFEEGFPAFVTILFMPLCYSVLDGIALGVLCHVVVMITMGRRREIHPLLYVISIVYIVVRFNLGV